MSPGERLLADPEARLQHARDLAWSALNRREHTVAEMRRVLERKRVDPGEVSAVVTELLDAGHEPHSSASELWTAHTRHPTLLAALVMDRDELTKRIDARIDRMLAEGSL